ncbi:hypothetical protein [Photorhabdus heterorhabditis]|nr:hypothetical protein [Photorhabdus heterorhabditis]
MAIVIGVAIVPVAQRMPAYDLLNNIYTCYLSSCLFVGCTHPVTELSMT